MGQGETGKKAKTTPEVGGKSVSAKSQVTHTRKNPFEKSSSKKTQDFVVGIFPITQYFQYHRHNISNICHWNTLIYRTL